jgi:multidrug efflux pump subunit AcrA (membrane-fusion protein)
VLEQQVSVGQRVEQSAPLYRIARLDPLSVDIQAPLAVAAGCAPAHRCASRPPAPAAR